jgi:hypothetical protein
MDISKRRVGRPKASPQTGPLVLSERRARAKIQIEIGTEAAEELAAYVRWLEVSEGMSTADAQAATVEFALQSVFKRDRLWQEWRRQGDRDDREQVAPVPMAVRSAQPVAASSSLPPPSGTRGSSNATPAVGAPVKSAQQA